MIKSNIKIIVNNGIIKSLEPCSSGVEIISSNDIYYYPDSCVMPGITDSHCHLWGLGMMLNGMDLSDAVSAENCIEIAKHKYSMRGDWIIGRGWNQEKWGSSNFPDKSILDDYFKDTPVAFTRIDGHSLWVNSIVLKLAGIDNYTPNPQGGEIIKDVSGNPTGIFLDNAMLLVEKLIPEFSDIQLKQFILTGIDEGIRNGLTSFHDMDVSPRHFKILQELDRSNKLKAKVYAYLSAQFDDYRTLREPRYSGKNLIVKGIKLYIDGALGSRGAALFQPYSDEPSNYGLMSLSCNELFEKIETGINNGFDCAVHAIGDRANHTVLRAFHKIRTNYSENKAKLRVEHAQIISNEDLKFFAKNNIIASVQPIHCISDMLMAEKRLGKERCKDLAYKWKSFLDLGIQIAAGSDFPIESHNPFLGIDAFVNRKSNLGVAWNEEERITLEQALNAYITKPNEIVAVHNSGKIETGNKADFIIIDNDLSDNSKIKNTFVEAAFIEGEMV
jgi:predicted amidohydrolase YtcJ